MRDVQMFSLMPYLPHFYLSLSSFCLNCLAICSAELCQIQKHLGVCI
uniref:Uncharacterized protein n=1 Tax=Anguilla anguilla TaxID=7936 RepID=A0A0E9PZE5_ANGAN